MEEPAIYRTRVGVYENEPDNLPSEENTFKSTTVASNAGADTVSDKDYDIFVIPEDRKLGLWSTTLLIINRMVGVGIYSVPSAIIKGTNSVGVAMLFWVLGGIMTFGMFVYLEFGTAIPRSGGEKVYLERIYRRPRYLATCIFAVQFVLFAVSTGGAISFSSYILRSATGDAKDGTWLNRGIAVAAITAVCLIHAFTPKLGIWISNGLGAFKLFLLSLVVFTGFAALAGHTIGPGPNNFSSFHGPGDAKDEIDQTNAVGAAAQSALALLQVQYAYSGWENANYVLTELRNPPRTLRRAAPIAVTIVTILYVLANIAYFAALKKEEIANAKVVVAADFFEKVWGSSVFVTKVMPVFIALSAIGNVFAQSFAMPRVKQEFAKEGILPFSRFWASDWPMNAPSTAILLHWIFSVALILGSSTSDTYNFVTNIFIYSSNWIKVFLATGLIYLTFNLKENWRDQRTSFKNYTPITIFYVFCLLFTLAAPFVPNDGFVNIPFWVVPALGTGMLVIGTAYWLAWARVMPLVGFQLQHEVQLLPDGSERVKYTHVKSRKGNRRGQMRV